MLENQFFPTPDSVLRRMFAPWKTDWAERRNEDYVSFSGRVIDPQAGHGKILQWMQNNYLHRYNGKSNLHACEIDPDLRTILADAGYQVVGSDWLTYEEPVTYDIIASNPPFATGAKHWLKNYQYLADGGHLVCLLNRETLVNPYTEERKRLLYQLASSWGIDADGYPNTQEGIYQLLSALAQVGAYEDFGECFRGVDGAERIAHVKIACTWIHKPKRVSDDFDWASVSGFKREQGEVSLDDPEFKENPLAHRSAIRTLVAKYKLAVQALQERQQANARLQHWIEELPGYSYGDIRASDIAYGVPFLQELATLKAMFWTLVFVKTDLGSRIGSKSQEEFRRFAIQQERLEFSEQNIIHLLETLRCNLHQIMDRLVAETFDNLVGFHADNRKHSEGWKTNAPGKIKKDKVILPDHLRWDQTFDTMKVYREDFLKDLDKALCYVSGIDCKGLSDRGETLVQAIQAHCTYHFGRGRYQEGYIPKDYREQFESYFFKIKVFKKGTIHLWFKDPKVCADFAVTAVKGRQWLSETDPAA